MIPGITHDLRREAMCIVDYSTDDELWAFHKDVFTALCDAIDAVDANLIAENERLREELGQ